jgi:hypothetical protein
VELRLDVTGIDIPATAETEGFAGKPEEQRLTITKGEAGTSMVLPPYSLRVIKL